MSLAASRSCKAWKLQSLGHEALHPSCHQPYRPSQPSSQWRSSPSLSSISQRHLSTTGQMSCHMTPVRAQGRTNTSEVLNEVLPWFLMRFSCHSFLLRPAFPCKFLLCLQLRVEKILDLHQLPFPCALPNGLPICTAFDSKNRFAIFILASITLIITSEGNERDLSLLTFVIFHVCLLGEVNRVLILVLSLTCRHVVPYLATLGAPVVSIGMLWTVPFIAVRLLVKQAQLWLFAWGRCCIAATFIQWFFHNLWEIIYLLRRKVNIWFKVAVS